MALGDQATIQAVNASALVGVTFVCTNDGTINTTPQVSRSLSNTTGSVVYGAVACSTCGKRFLIQAQLAAMTIDVQQTS
jgi:hypothetical protein